MDNRSVFTVFRRALHRRGFGVVHAVNYGSVPATSARRRQLRRHVERVGEPTGADKVHIVGHSLGGLIARYYVQRMGGSARVDTLGSPHRGTLAAYLIPTPLARQLRPGSALLAELGSPRPAAPRGSWSCGAGWTRWSCRSARAAAAPRPRRRRAELRDVGHLSLPSTPGRALGVDRARPIGRLRPPRPTTPSRPGSGDGRCPVVARILTSARRPRHAASRICPARRPATFARVRITNRSRRQRDRPRSIPRDPHPRRRDPITDDRTSREGQVLARHRSPQRRPGGRLRPHGAAARRAVRG